MESKVIGVKTLCVTGIAGHSIQAGDIIIYLWGFHVHFSWFFINFIIFWPS